MTESQIAQVSGQTLRIAAGPNSDIDILVDVVGYFDTNGGGGFTAQASRIWDTRTADHVAIAPNGVITVPTAGFGGIPTQASGLGSVALAFTVVRPTVGGYARVWAEGAAEPLVQSITFSPGDLLTSSTIVTATPPTTGRVKIRNASSQPLDVIVDTQGWFSRSRAVPASEEADFRAAAISFGATSAQIDQAIWSADVLASIPIETTIGMYTYDQSPTDTAGTNALNSVGVTAADINTSASVDSPASVAATVATASSATDPYTPDEIAAEEAPTLGAPDDTGYATVPTPPDDPAPPGDSLQPDGATGGSTSAGTLSTSKRPPPPFYVDRVRFFTERHRNYTEFPLRRGFYYSDEDRGFGLDKIGYKHNLDRFAPSAVDKYAYKFEEPSASRVVARAHLDLLKCKLWGAYRSCKAPEAGRLDRSLRL